MTYVIDEPCIGIKDTSCVEVCPVDCIHPTLDEPTSTSASSSTSTPEECIDCDACVEACPVDAITPEDMIPSDWQKYIEIDAAYFREQAAWGTVVIFLAGSVIVGTGSAEALPSQLARPRTRR